MSGIKGENGTEGRRPNRRSTPEGAEVKGLKSKVLSTPSATLVPLSQRDNLADER